MPSTPATTSLATPIPVRSGSAMVNQSIWWSDFFQKLYRVSQYLFGWQGSDVASANDLYLAVESGDSFYITGTTTINAIGTKGWRDGKEITLLFASTPTVKNNTAGSAGTAVLHLAGATDWNTITANDMLTLKKMNGEWFEKARSVN